MNLKKRMFVSIFMILTVIASFSPLSALMAPASVCTATCSWSGGYITCSVVECSGDWYCLVWWSGDECGVECGCGGSGTLTGEATW